jgi:hypothetical protein
VLPILQRFFSLDDSLPDDSGGLLITRSDVASIKQAIARSDFSPSPGESDPKITDGDPARLVYKFNDGWWSDFITAKYYRVFVVSGGRKFKLRGEFIELEPGRWTCRVTRVARLLTRDEASSLEVHMPSGCVELVPSPEEARAAIKRWILSTPKRPEQYLQGVWGRAVQIVASPESVASLSRSEARITESAVDIAEWHILINELRFKRMIQFPPGSYILPMELHGHVHLSTHGTWEVDGEGLASTGK